MNRIFGAAFMAAMLSAATGAATADEMVRASRTVDARVLKVKLGGAISVRIRQGDTPSLVPETEWAGLGHCAWQAGRAQFECARTR
ncbi:MAG: hypothetical protein WA191_07280 [Telluria sp.]|nr:hypothetical protein [Telluria sp.]